MEGSGVHSIQRPTQLAYNVNLLAIVNLEIINMINLIQFFKRKKSAQKSAQQSAQESAQTIHTATKPDEPKAEKIYICRARVK